MKRYTVNKNRAARSFRHEVQSTKRINMAPRPMRGGFRL